MKRILIALALALGATAAVAEPSLNAAQNQIVWTNASEGTSYQAGGQLVDNNAPSYSLIP